MGLSTFHYVEHIKKRAKYSFKQYGGYTTTLKTQALRGLPGLR